jgi:hypothetical protein
VKSQPTAHTVTVFLETLLGDQGVPVGAGVNVAVAVGLGVRVGTSVAVGVAVGRGVSVDVGVEVGSGVYGDETGLVICGIVAIVGDSGTDVGSGFPQPVTKIRTIVTTTTVL